MFTPETAPNSSDRFIQAGEAIVSAAKHLCPSIRGDVQGAVLGQAFSLAHDSAKTISRRKRSVRKIGSTLQEISQRDPMQTAHAVEYVERALFDALEVPSEYNPHF